MRLTYIPAIDDHAAWSPDGRRIAFTSERGSGQSELFVMNADGSNVVREALPPHCSRRPVGTFTHRGHRRAGSSRWSPNGAQFATTISQKVGNEYVTHIGVMDSDGTDLTPLIEAATWSKSSWSPDGTVILFTSGTVGAFDVSWVKIDGSASGPIITNGWNGAWQPCGAFNR